MCLAHALTTTGSVISCVRGVEIVKGDKMAEALQLTLDGYLLSYYEAEELQQRKKLQVVKYYYENDKNLYQTCKKSPRNRRTFCAGYKKRRRSEMAAKETSTIK